MDKSNKPETPEFSHRQVENLVRRSLSNRMDKEPERSGTFFAIQDQLNDQSRSGFFEWIFDSLGFRWRVTTMFRKRIAQGTAFVMIAAVIVAYVAFLGSDSENDGASSGVASGGGVPGAESGGDAISVETDDSTIVVYPTIGAPPENIILDVLEPRPLRNNLIDSSAMSDPELLSAWTGYLVASRLIFDDGVSGFQDWRICGNNRGVVVGDHSGRNSGQYFSWDLNTASGVTTLDIDLDIEGRSALLTASDPDDQLLLVVHDEAVVFDLGTENLVAVGVMDALEEADRCPDYAPGPPSTNGDVEPVGLSDAIGTAVPPESDAEPK